MIKLMYITNDPAVAAVAEEAGADRIFIDLEVIGKAERQGGMDTVQSHHAIADIAPVKEHLRRAGLLVRCNPVHPGSQAEIDAIIAAGADIIMLPFFRSVGEVADFLRFVGGRVRTMLLVETREAVDLINDIIALPGIDEFYIGLNDLHLSYGLDFMFQLLADGTVERLASRFHAAGIPYGFGGIARIGLGLLPAEYVIGEHQRLGSTCAILSRSFCNCATISSLDEVRTIFGTGVAEVRDAERYWSRCTPAQLEANRRKVAGAVDSIVAKIRENRR